MAAGMKMLPEAGFFSRMSQEIRQIYSRLPMRKNIFGKWRMNISKVKAMAYRKSLVSVLSVVLVLTFSCTKEEIKSQYSRQEQNIETFVNSTLSSIDTSYVVRNRGVDRLVIVPGAGDSLERSGTVSFYYAGYVLSSSSISSSTLFSTNRRDVALAADWTVSDSTAFDIRTLNLAESDLVDGLKYGLEGVKGGQECYILFSGKYGFGKKSLGTIPANAALAYHVWVESISNE